MASDKKTDPKKKTVHSENKFLMDSYGKKLPKKTSSLCPTCMEKIPAVISEKGGKVIIEKTCKIHGKFSEVYFADPKMYERFRKYGYTAKGTINPNTKTVKNCPFDCGLCKNHKSSTLLANLVLTNRCDLRCWYCFYYAKEGEQVYEPSLDKIQEMLDVARNQKPVPPVAIQLTGGNPELRPDLLEIVKMCKKAGFFHIQLNTQGTHRLQHDLAFMKKLYKEGVSTIYLSFDGTSEKTNPKNHWEIPYILDNARKAKIGIVLVPTIINGVNDSEIGNIVNFALNNLDVVRAVNFQPVSLVGRMPKNKRDEQRITIPEVAQILEEQSSGAISKKDFYPIPCVKPLTRFVTAFAGEQQSSFSSHFACGAGTYVFLCGKRIIPITSFIDVEGFFNYLDELSEQLEKGSKKEIIAVKALLNLKKFINKKKEPKGLNIYKLIYDSIIKHDYETLGKFHDRTLFIGMMHFMDLYNYDVERVERCCIHYLMPDKRIIPFCTFNVMPGLYRDAVQKNFSIPSKEWEKKNKRKLSDDIYKRDILKLKGGKAYTKTYGSIVDYYKIYKERFKKN